jgi:hypothetical protein
LVLYQVNRFKLRFKFWWKKCILVLDWPRFKRKFETLNLKRYKIFIFLIIGPKMGILINNMKIIHTSTFTIIHTNFNHYLETTQRKQREMIIRRKESVSHKEDTIYEYIYYIKKSLKIIIVFITLNNLLIFSW